MISAPQNYPAAKFMYAWNFITARLLAAPGGVKKQSRTAALKQSTVFLRDQLGDLLQFLLCDVLTLQQGVNQLHDVRLVPV